MSGLDRPTHDERVLQSGNESRLIYRLWPGRPQWLMSNRIFFFPTMNDDDDHHVFFISSVFRLVVAVLIFSSTQRERDWSLTHRSQRVLKTLFKRPFYIWSFVFLCRRRDEYLDSPSQQHLFPFSQKRPLKEKSLETLEPMVVVAGQKNNRQRDRNRYGPLAEPIKISPPTPVWYFYIARLWRPTPNNIRLAMIPLFFLHLKMYNVRSAAKKCRMTHTNGRRIGCGAVMFMLSCTTPIVLAIGTLMISTSHPYFFLFSVVVYTVIIQMTHGGQRRDKRPLRPTWSKKHPATGHFSDVQERIEYLSILCWALFLSLEEIIWIIKQDKNVFIEPQTIGAGS